MEKFLELLKDNPMLAKHFDETSPEVLQVAVPF